MSIADSIRNFKTDDRYFLFKAFLVSISFSRKKLKNWKVGAVLVKEGKVLASYRNNPKCKTHAEEYIFRNVCEKEAKDLTLYLTLPPCTYRNNGNPNCTDLIINHGVSRVVCLLDRDVNSRVRNFGLTKLTQNHIEVTIPKLKFIKLLYLILNFGVLLKHKKRKNFMVDRGGIEPPTSSMRMKRSTN